MFARMLTFLTLVTFVGAPAAARSADAAKNATPPSSSGWILSITCSRT